MGYIRKIQIRFADCGIDDHGIGNRAANNKSIATVVITLFIASFFAGCGRQRPLPTVANGPQPKVTNLPQPTYPDETEMRKLIGVSDINAPHDILIEWAKTGSSYDWVMNATDNERRKLGRDPVVFDAGAIALDSKMREGIPS